MPRSSSEQPWDHAPQCTLWYYRRYPSERGPSVSSCAIICSYWHAKQTRSTRSSAANGCNTPHMLHYCTDRASNCDSRASDTRCPSRPGPFSWCQYLSNLTVHSRSCWEIAISHKNNIQTLLPDLSNKLMLCSKKTPDLSTTQNYIDISVLL